jgi:hypothetical protein
MEKILSPDSNTKCSRSLKTNRPRELSVAPSTSAASTRSTPAASGPVRGSASPQRSGRTCGRGKVAFTGLARFAPLGPFFCVWLQIPFSSLNLNLAHDLGQPCASYVHMVTGANEVAKGAGLHCLRLCIMRLKISATTFRKFGRKTRIFSRRVVPKAPNASCTRRRRGAGHVAHLDDAGGKHGGVELDTALGAGQDLQRAEGGPPRRVRLSP